MQQPLLFHFCLCWICSFTMLVAQIRETWFFILSWILFVEYNWDQQKRCIFLRNLWYNNRNCVSNVRLFILNSTRYDQRVNWSNILRSSCRARDFLLISLFPHGCRRFSFARVTNTLFTPKNRLYIPRCYDFPRFDWYLLVFLYTR